MLTNTNWSSLRTLWTSAVRSILWKGRKKYQNIKMVTEVYTVINIDDREKYEMCKEKVNKVLDESKEKQESNNRKCNGHQTFIKKSTNSV